MQGAKNWKFVYSLLTVLHMYQSKYKISKKNNVNIFLLNGAKIIDIEIEW